jgi:hypothetical protein
MDPFSTSAGTKTITLTVQGGLLAGQVNGATVYIPNTYTLNGVTFGGCAYTIRDIDKTKNTFAITGSGMAMQSVSGGGPGQYAFFTNLVPYAPTQLWGEFRHGLISTNARFDNGGIIETQPGNGILWNDGVRTASVNGSLVSPGHIDVILTPAGSGVIRANGAIALRDSGSAPITSASVTIPPTYEVALFDPTSNAITATIQACNAGRTWDQYYKDATKQAAVHNITLTTSGGTIEGSKSVSIHAAGESVHIHSNGTACYLL